LYWLGYIDSMKKRLPTYAIFNVNYRLAIFNGVTLTNTFPTQENDIKTVVDYIYGKRADYKISDKFVLIGASAGAHLATLQAYKNTTPKIKAVVDLFGPSDMVEMYNNPAQSVPPNAIAALLNGTPASNPTLYQSSSPINFVDITSPPTIIFHGGVSDTLVRTAQSIALQGKLQQKGVPFKYINYPAEGHGWVGANLTNTFNEIQAFLNANVQ
jgi:acetyl esterase/lipase